MAGFQQRKVFLSRSNKKSKRPCQAKGYPTANGKYLCMFHGGNNIKGFNQKNYTDDTRIKALSKLKQFRDKPREEIEQYYYKEVKPRIGTTERSKYYRKMLMRGVTLSEILEDKKLFVSQMSLQKFYAILKKDKELNHKITEARKIGIQTLIDKLLQIFQYQEVENPKSNIMDQREKQVYYLPSRKADRSLF